MTWLAPQWLWLLAAAPLAALLVLHAHARRRRAAERFVGSAVGARLLPAMERSRAISRAVLLGSGIALAALAAAGPSWGSFEEVIYTRGVDVVVALDVSRSMLTENDSLTPLERAKASLERLVRESPGDRLGLVLFAGSAAQSCVLTSDAGFFVDALRNAEPADAGRGGTRIGTALFAAHRVLEPRWYARHQKLFELVSDAALVRANRDQLCELLGVPTSADLESELIRLFDPQWQQTHENQLAKIFGESWTSSDLDDAADLRFEASGDADLDPLRGGKIVVLITDGIDQDSMPRLAARILARRGVRLVTVGVGEESRGERPLVLAGQPQRTRDGKPILLEFDSSLLRELASDSGGFYVGADQLLGLAERYRAEFPDLEETRGRRITLRRGIERYPFFLAPALLLLALYFATPAVPRGQRGAALAMKPVLLLCLSVLPALLLSCAEEDLSSHTDQALSALRSGDAKAAEDTLRSLQIKHPEDPRVAYDRAIALQALGDQGGADREYRKARTGSRALAAKAAFNQGTLALDQLRTQLQRGETALPPEELDATARRAFEEGIAKAQIAFGEARRLDPELAAAEAAETDLIRWRSALRDAWRRADAAARKRELEQVEGAALAEKLETWQREILGEAAADPLGAALREREMIDALPLLADRLAADEALDVAERDRLQARARTLEDPLLRCAEALEQLEAESAFGAGQMAAAELANIWTAWGALDATLKRLVADGRAMQQSANASEEATSNLRAAALADRTRIWIERARAREELPFGTAAGTWILEALPRAGDALQASIVAEIEPAAKLTATTNAGAAFEDATMALDFDALEAVPLLEKLADEEETVASQLEAGGETAFAKQARLLRSLDIAREKLREFLGAPEDASEEVRSARESFLAAQLAEIDAAVDPMERATNALEEPATLREAAREAARHLREAWARLAEFDALLRHSIRRGRDAVTNIASTHATDRGSDVLDAIARMRARLPQEIERLKRAAEQPEPGSNEDPEDALEIASILRDADPAFGKARDSILRGIDALKAEQNEQAKVAWEEALKRLEDVEAAIEEARKTLFERIEVAFERERNAQSVLHDALILAQPEPLQAAIEDERTKHAALESEAQAMKRALRRELARREREANAAAKNPEAPAPTAPSAPRDDAELKAEVEAAIAALELVQTTLSTDDGEVSMRAIAESFEALRRPWTRLASFEQIVRNAISEEQAVIERNRRAPEKAREKAFVRDLQRAVTDQLEPILQKAPAAAPPNQAVNTEEPKPEPGEIARRNVPLIREATTSAEAAIMTDEPLDALPFEEEALRLLEEILQSDQEQEQPQNSPENQPSEENEEGPQNSAAQPDPKDAPLSREEIERLLRLAKERKPNAEANQTRERTPLAEDH